MKHEQIRPDDECTRASKTRATVNVWCEVRQGTRPWKRTRLEDISPEGFRIGWLPGCHADTPLRIRIPGMQVLTAEIRWKRGVPDGARMSLVFRFPAFFPLL